MQILGYTKAYILNVFQVLKMSTLEIFGAELM